MNILITGGTGFLGKHLSEYFVENDYAVSVLSRRASSINGVKSFYWNPAEQKIDEDSLKETDCIIHLTGASLSEGRWTKKRKKEIIDSRVKSGELLYEQLKKSRHRVKTFLSASGIGIYGNTGDLWVDESSGQENDFIGEVCKSWEAAANKIASLGIRVVIVRIGIVLAKDGGALPVFARPLKLFAGAALGSGSQYLSWVHVDDLCRVFMKAVSDDSMQGTYNAVAPNPRTNAEFTKTLAKILKRPVWPIHIPAFALKLLLGEKATIALDGQRVLAKRLKLTAFRFQFRELNDALKNIYKT